MPLRIWYQETQKAEWRTPNDVKKDHPSASIINKNRVVFNIKGNKYRLVCHIRYRIGIVYIRFIGTHAEYDKINVEEV